MAKENVAYPGNESSRDDDSREDGELEGREKVAATSEPSTRRKLQKEEVLLT